VPGRPGKFRIGGRCNGEPADVDRGGGMSIRGRPEPTLYPSESSSRWTRVHLRLSQKILIDSGKNFIACWGLHELSSAKAAATHHTTFGRICSIDKHCQRCDGIVVLPKPGPNGRSTRPERHDRAS